MKALSEFLMDGLYEMSCFEYKLWSYLVLKIREGHIDALRISYLDLASILGMGVGEITAVKNSLVSKGWIKVNVGSKSTGATIWRLLHAK